MAVECGGPVRRNLAQRSLPDANEARGIAGIAKEAVRGLCNMELESHLSWRVRAGQAERD